MSELLSGVEEFIDGVNLGLDRVGVGRDELKMMDHACYRVTSVIRYREVLANLGTQLRLLGAAPVNGREISTLEIIDPVVHGGWTVPYLELPEPKPDNKYPEGLEHVEFVIVGSLEDFISRHPDLNFDHTGMEKRPNRELGYRDDGLSVKFHNMPLGEVVWRDFKRGDGTWLAGTPYSYSLTEV
jgi:uncharacterized protein